MKKFFMTIMVVMTTLSFISCGGSGKSEKVYLEHIRDSINSEIELYETLRDNARNDILNIDLDVNPEKCKDVEILYALIQDYSSKIDNDKEKVFQLELAIYGK